MVTQNATVLEQHLQLTGESPANLQHRCRRRLLNKEDPMSHRIIEKRRRDRMNNCLADLSRLIPADYLKKGRGRVEKTEIIEMAIKHMKHLQALACRQIDQCELNQQRSPEEQNTNHSSSGGGGGPIVIEHYRLGYQECLSETMHFLVEVEGFFAGDLICIELMNHLQKHCDKILKGNHINYPRAHLIETNSTSSGSTGSSSYHHTNSSALGSSAPGSSSSPGSGSCSDSGRNEIKEPVINGHPSTIHCLSKVIPPQMCANENSCNDDNHSNHSGPSQLREMLTGVNRSSNSLHIVNNKQNTLTPLAQTFQSPSPGLSNGMGNSSSVEHNGINGSSSAASLYKFKNNIKQRFSAEHHVDDRHHESRASNGIDPSCHYSGMKRRRYVTDVNDETPHDNNANNLLTFPMVQPSSRRRDSETCSVPSSPPSPEPKYIPPRTPSPEDTRMRGSPHRPIPNYGIPIFALHPKGTFYIPLTLDSEVLAPHFSDLGYAPELIHEVVHPVILHPVTISVNFQRVGQYTRTPRMMQPQLNHCASVSWNNEQNGFVPVQ